MMRHSLIELRLDPEYPADRIDYILSDGGIETILTIEDLAQEKAIGVVNVICVDLQAGEIALESTQRLDRHLVCTTERDLSYVIYTSGSTGRPKGVEIEHRSSTNYIQVVNESVYQIQPHDRVYQGFSIAFDASVEEVWCTFAAGATLVVGSVEQTRSGVDLAQFLTQQQVTVLSCVPTLLAMMEVEVPTIRLLILGGEQCPQELISRWCNPQRRVLNTYGPTEATVVSTYQECHPDRVITIGKALPTYYVYILDEDFQLCPPGVEGEIYIGGICLARGYVGRPDLTAEKFINLDESKSMRIIPNRLYKTGDLGSWNDDGEIQFLGRIDGQVKLRGFRIELSEIESVIMQCAGVSAAVVAVKKVANIDRLIAYLVPKQSLAELDLGGIYETMRSRLPAYMVPTSLEILASLPTLPSGKVDRKSLPDPQNIGVNFQSSNGRQATNETESKIAFIWSEILGISDISIDADFFQELGGHSLLAAIVISKLRENPQFQDLAVLDIYQHPTVAKLATALADRQQHPTSTQHGETRERPTAKAHPSGHVWTILGIYVLYFIYSTPIVLPFSVFDILYDDGWNKYAALALSGIVLLSIQPSLLLISIGLKWLTIGKYKAGSYPLWGNYYWRFWFMQQVHKLVSTEYLAGSPLLNTYYCLLGVKLGQNVYLGGIELVAADLITIGENTSINDGASLVGYEIVDGRLNIGNITIGRDCFVGSNTMLGLHTQLVDRSRIDDLSYLGNGLNIPAGEAWIGSPAKLDPNTSSQIDELLTPVPKCGNLLKLGYLIGSIAVWLVPFISAIPGFLLWQELLKELEIDELLLPAAILGSFSFVGIFCLQILLYKWILLGRIKPGNYPVYSSFGLRKWWIDRLMSMSLDMMPTLYSTLYLLPWLRMLGAKIGARTEISTATNITPDLLSIGSESFIADTVSLGAAKVDRGWMELAPTRIGSQTFVGNGALIPAHSTIADNSLIGCLSIPPVGDTPMQPDTAWLGSPAIYIPHREVIDSYEEAQTYKPPRYLYAIRLAIEFLRVTLPGSIHFIVLFTLEVGLTVIADANSSWEWDLAIWAAVFLWFPFCYFLFTALSTFFVIGLKWSIVGRYRSGTIPLWNSFIWRTELITGLYEAIIVPGFLFFLLGTPFAPMLLRLLGMKIGRNVYIETTDFTEFDLITIDDNVILDRDSTLQTHLFEDRVMKLGKLHLYPRAQVGSWGMILYDTVLEQDVLIQPMSLVMKGEKLPPATTWQGIPVTRSYD
ncbi:Pls/PosA family non-ribosomal peptide synthetase [Chamaesiphon minutus]|uniref:Amino acid adenylation enzyme/thioester reductase family protein n=1 Tax=Chamaesiphon minutus (strain ATCC 27169 / PCC 6605) TaxID=1173020 RepID=K9UFN5_CHAP6|nr:Pls/PosA family non-ribosomal peptide synthetase [Chamaesiphon minutus]AFY93019.1 amino acid adenylation enzyme/thioester reductase family protein [Chamaesiphon minutus PCC 6605]